MSPTLPTEQIDRIVWNQHHDPFTVLGSHKIEQDGKSVWVVRAYLPDAEAVSVITPDQQKEYPMQSVHHPHFFECIITDAPHLFSYQLKVKSGDSDRLIHDPYSFKSPLLTEFDAYLFGQGTHYQIYEKMGAHLTTIDGISGVYFAVWAPNARNVSLIGDFNSWDGRKHQMRRGSTGIWDLFIPDLEVGASYKYEIKSPEGHIYEKSDPYGHFQEIRPKTASVVADLSTYEWSDRAWLDKRTAEDPLKKPISVYEMHLGSWMHASSAQPPESGYPGVAAADLKPGARFLTYRELAEDLIPYVKEMGYTHIEMMPVAEHPFDGSWGYQVTGYYAPTSRYGTPQDLMYFIDQCHQNEIGVIVDWVPAHFPKDGHGLSFFDGTFLYEPADVRIGEHKEWGTKIFNYDRSEVKNFLIANVLFWFDKYHIDGIRVDAVASMLHRDYNRDPGTWLPNKYGGREALEVIELFRHLHTILFTYYPGVLSIAEESTSWPMVTGSAYLGGLGFNLKWNMGWMHDMLDYFKLDPYFRGHNNNYLTFSIWYAFSENFMLALSHDEVVHGKSPMIGKMPGDEWQKFANLRCLYGYMFTHPGKKTMFMGMEFGQWSEWNVWGDLEWHLLQYPKHKALQKYVGDLNKLLRSLPELYTQDFVQEGFEWIECNDTKNSVISFLRKGLDDEFVLVVCNFTPVVHHNYRIGVPEKGFYKEVLNSDAPIYGGSGIGNLGGKYSDDYGRHGKPYSIDVTAPPLGIVVFKYTGGV
jgi:1,4-alpha-glucan branching enzyme